MDLRAKIIQTIMITCIMTYLEHMALSKYKHNCPCITYCMIAELDKWCCVEQVVCIAHINTAIRTTATSGVHLMEYKLCTQTIFRQNWTYLGSHLPHLIYINLHVIYRSNVIRTLGVKIQNIKKTSFKL